MKGIFKRRKTEKAEEAEKTRLVEELAERDPLAREMYSLATAVAHVLELQATGAVSRGEALAIYHMLLSSAMYTVLSEMLPAPGNVKHVPQLYRERGRIEDAEAAAEAQVD